MVLYAWIAFFEKNQEKTEYPKEEPLIQFRNQHGGIFKNLKHNKRENPNTVIFTKNK